MNRWKQKVACPEEGCSAVQRRSNMLTHLQSSVHGYTAGRASEVVKALPGVEEEGAALPAVVVSVPAKRVRTPRGWDWTEVDPAEIALGVIESQAPGAIPVELLAEVVAYVDHTRALVASLRRARR